MGIASEFGVLRICPERVSVCVLQPRQDRTNDPPPISGRSLSKPAYHTTMLQLTESRPAVYLLAFVTTFLVGCFAVSFSRRYSSKQFIRQEKKEKEPTRKPGGICTQLSPRRVFDLTRVFVEVWIPVAFESPVPAPYPDWDVHTTKPLPYRPFKYGPK